jgi:hypothetical protein
MTEPKSVYRNSQTQTVLDPSLLADPRFQNLLAKAENHQRQFRPKETERLERDGQLTATLQERTQTCWEVLRTTRQNGMTMLEAQEIAFPIILLPDENDDLN